MLVFLYGPDTYRSRQKLNGIVEEYKSLHKSGLNLKVFDCGNADFQDFRNELRTVSMFEGKKLLILKNAFSSVHFEKNLLPELSGVKGQEEEKDTIVFYENGEVKPGKSPLYSFLIKHAKTQEFGLLSGLKLENWVKKEFQGYHSEIAPEALKTLILYCGNNLWQLSNEIRKLSSYSQKKVSQDDVKNLVKSEVGTNIFETIEAIAAKNKKMALVFLHRHLEKGEAPLRLLSMISYQFRNIILVKYLLEKGTQYPLIAKKTDFHPFVVRKTYDLCRSFTYLEIKKIYQKIFQIDLEIKTGKIDPEAALDLFIAEI
ncbi:MAG: DNA polymerase III subunit delta [Candidatus Wildermuthbacteria bacterium]|nr:DNA polymerase III subunit delta [Candidatus Wildermuthbacteria bacterium]